MADMLIGQGVGSGFGGLLGDFGRHGLLGGDLGYRVLRRHFVDLRVLRRFLEFSKVFWTKVWYISLGRSFPKVLDLILLFSSILLCTTKGWLLPASFNT